MKIRTYTRGQVIFREGDAGDCMFDIQEGKVGIFSDYQGPQEKQIAVLFTDQIFGEMGLLDGAPRSATAVALETAVVDVVSEDEFYEYFEKKPEKVLQLMQQMCNRLRRTSKDYLEACRTVYETTEAEKAGRKKSGGLRAMIQKFCSVYQNTLV